jgi:hypothetical protein
VALDGRTSGHVCCAAGGVAHRKARHLVAKGAPAAVVEKVLRECVKAYKHHIAEHGLCGPGLDRIMEGLEMLATLLEEKDKGRSKGESRALIEARSIRAEVAETRAILDSQWRAMLDEVKRTAAMLREKRGQGDTAGAGKARGKGRKHKKAKSKAKAKTKGQASAQAKASGRGVGEREEGPAGRQGEGLPWAEEEGVGDGDDECPICSCYLAGEGEEGGDDAVVTTPCAHIFHEDCLRHWADRCGQGGWGFTCPMCRGPLSIGIFPEPSGCC